MKIIPVILCGGAGTRLWPLSRAQMPKQLLTLFGEHSLLQDTWLRTRKARPEVLGPQVVCNEAHRFLVDAQLLAVGIEPTLVLEPAGRNTAPAVALAALLAGAGRGGAGAMLLVLPSDHVIRDVGAFARALDAGLTAAADGELVTFGIVPERPETGYGYIRAKTGAAPHRIAEFVEKPDLATAQEYVASGSYFWNSGMFLFRAESYLQELREHAPDIYSACHRAVAEARIDQRVVHPGREAFLSSPSVSIDYAVMENTSRGTVVPMDAGWSDVGTWGALLDASAVDSNGNSLHGDVVAVGCANSLIRAESRLVGAVGLDECIVVETKDAILVAPRERAQDVKALVEELSTRNRQETVHGREVFRPWGSYDSLESRPGFQVKRLAVLPGAILSLQLHHRRAEHWVVVSGHARITLDDRIFDLKRNEHTYIPVGARHRIENPGTELLEIIEVQIGDYLGEDDIVRLEDKYGRQGRTD